METTENKTYQYIVPVRFHSNDKAYSFGSDEEDFEVGQDVVVETIRGMELGKVADKVQPMKEELADVIKPILRKATPKDIEDDLKNRAEEPEAMEKCRKAIEELDLPMVLTSAEYTLDRGKVVFTYVAEERVDFRELLKTLASIFHTRIELRQIGPRDKAKMVGGIGICGMRLCCNRFQKDFGTISINMAKNQLLALNPQKLSGQCGKLMCCLAYENEDYKLLREGLPKMNASIIYQDKRYRVTSMNVLDNSARLSNVNEFVDMSLDELKELIAYNAEHNITTQNFIKAQREKEMAEKEKGSVEEKVEKRSSPLDRGINVKRDAMNKAPKNNTNQDQNRNNNAHNNQNRNNNNQRNNHRRFNNHRPNNQGDQGGSNK